MEYIRSRCQIFTPEDKVKLMLSKIKYNENVYNRKIMENSFGDGAFLVQIVKLFIKDAFRLGKSINEVKTSLENCIYGIEKDKLLFEKTKNTLNDLVKEYGVFDVNWRLYNTDTLNISFIDKFDFIVGNPPYISYHDLTNNERVHLKKLYKSCSSGLFDIYFAFIEWSLKHLSDIGELIYIVPNSIYKNSSGKVIRSMILPKLKMIMNYKREQVFQNVLTSVTIIHIDNKIKTRNIIYINDDYLSKKISKYDLDSKDKWNFYSQDVNSVSYRFGDYFNVFNSVATLKNKIFISNDFSSKGELTIFNGKMVESNILRDACSIKNMNNNKKGKIIFPYKYTNDKLICLDEDEMINIYPYTYNYLLNNKKNLLSCERDKSSRWYEFGRSQGLQKLNQEKLLMSRIFTKKIQVYELSSNQIPYSGLCVIKKKKLSLEIAKEILKSDDFRKYLLNIGMNMSGESIQVSSKDVENYMFCVDKEWECNEWIE